MSTLRQTEDAIMKPILPATALLGLALLAGCGGDSTPFARHASRPDTAEGLWSGVFSLNTDATPDSRRFQALVTPGGQLWMAYTQPGSTLLGGLVQGSGNSDSSAHTYAAASVTEHDGNGSRTGALSARYVAQDRFGGSITTLADTVRTLVFNPAFVANYNQAYALERPALPATATQVTAQGLTPTGAADISVTLNGAAVPDFMLQGSAGPSGGRCFFHGPVTASTEGNYFNASLTVIASPACDALGLSGPLAGVLYRSSPDGKWVLVTSDATFGFLEK